MYYHQLFVIKEQCENISSILSICFHYNGKFPTIHDFFKELCVEYAS